MHQAAFDFSCLILTGPTPTLLGMPPEIREIILGYAIADIMGTPTARGRLHKGTSITDQVAHRKHLFLSGKRTFFALLVTCQRIRWDMPRVIHMQLGSTFNGWRDTRIKKHLLDPERDRSGFDERWSFLLKALARLEGLNEAGTQPRKKNIEHTGAGQPTHEGNKQRSRHSVGAKKPRYLLEAGANQDVMPVALDAATGLTL